MQEHAHPLTLSTGTLVRAVVIVILFIAAYILRDVILVLLTSVVIASAIEPLTLLLTQYRVHRTIAVIAIYLLVICVFGAILFVFIPLLLDDFSQVSDLLPHIANEPGIFSPLFERFPDLLQAVNHGVSLTDVFPALGTMSSGIGGGVVTTARLLFRGFIGFILTIVLSFYLSVQEDGVESFLRLVSSQHQESYIVGLWQRTRKKIGLWMQGQLLLGLLIGVFVYLGLAIFGIKYALLLAILAAVFEIIPVFGPILAAVPAVIVGFTYSIPTGLSILAFYIIIQQFENHLIYPLVVRKIIGIPPLLVIIALVIGAELGGFLGIILSVPLATLLVEMIADFEKHKKSLASVQA